MPEPRVKRDPEVMMVKPVVVGTRITVEHILRLLGAGDSIEDILRNHPQLTEVDIRAAQPIIWRTRAFPPLSSRRGPLFCRRVRCRRGRTGLRSEGLDVVYAKEVCPGKGDSEVLRLAAEAGRILVTDDLGFGELAVRRGQPAAGVVILSLHQMPVGARERYAVRRIRGLGDGANNHLADRARQNSVTPVAAGPSVTATRAALPPIRRGPYSLLPLILLRC